MAVYLKEFETQAAYEAAESSLILPNVSLITDNNTVHYNPSSPVPPTPSHDYVEIAGIKWATMNVGANSVTDYGLYFQWGDVQGYTAAQVGSGEGQKYFGWADYKYGNGTSSPDHTDMTKYNDTDGKTVLDASDDAVTAAWGGNWRMPTIEEFEALGAVCSTEWTTTYEGSGSGRILTVTADTADKGKQLFFPAAGSFYDGVTDIYYGDGGSYWSSSVRSDAVAYAYKFILSRYYIRWRETSTRHYGFPIRGVLDE